MADDTNTESAMVDKVALLAFNAMRTANQYPEADTIELAPAREIYRDAAREIIAAITGTQAPVQDFAGAPISLDARRADKARDAKLYTARDALVEELRDIDAGVVTLDAIVIYTRIPDGNGLWTSGWRFAGLNTTEAVGFTALCLNMLMDRSRTGG